MWLFLITGGLCAAGRVIAVMFPGTILPKPDVSTLLWISVVALVLRGLRQSALGSERLAIRTSRGGMWRLIARLWDGLTALAAFSLFPLAAGIMSGSDCWRVALAGAAVYVAAAEVMDTVGERMASGGRGRVAFAVNGLLLGLAGQAMNHIFF